MADFCTTNHRRRSTRPNLSIRLPFGPLVGLLLACIALPSASPSVVLAQSAPEIRFPYQALVTKDNAVIRSGPASVHYGTQSLQPGDAVEVFRHDPDGWCAIRPVDGSFSLIPESTIIMVREGVGEVQEEGTRAWVGTQLGAVDQPLWQIKLRKGEQVKVLGQLTWPNPAGHSSVWYQIAPPPGEFRWIHQADLETLDTVLPNLAAVDQNASPNTPHDPDVPELDSAIQLSEPAADQRTLPAISNLGQPSASGVESPWPVQPAAAFIVEPDQVPEATDNEGWRRSRRPLDRFDSVPEASFAPTSGADPQLRTSPNRYASGTGSNEAFANQLAQARLASAATGPTGNEPAFQPSRLMSSGNPVLDLENGLTTELLKPPGSWDLRSLTSMANQLLSTAPDMQAKSQVEAILVKINRCQALQSGYAQSGSNAQTPSAGPNLTGTTTSGFPIQRPISNPDTESPFDAQGWLNELKQSRGTEPSTYVLQDDTGTITHHLQPAAGINLTRYLKTRIGVVGQRGFNQRLGLNHVLVNRVFPLAQ